MQRAACRAGAWVAFALFRDHDGVTRQVERRGVTGAAAERALLAALRECARLPNEDVTPEPRLNRVIDDWDAKLDERDFSDGSRTTYRRQLKHIRKAMGSLRLREVTVQAAVAGNDIAGDQLGHVKGSTVTRKSYIKRLHLGSDVRDILE